MTDRSVRGRLVWHELLTPDTAAGYDFYTRVIGWRTQPWEHDPSYVMFVAQTGPVGAAVADTGSPHWRHYLSVDDIDATVALATRLGGAIVIEPATLPEGSRYAVLSDPQGAVFGVFQAMSPTGGDEAPKVGQFSWLELAAADARAALDFYTELFGWQITAEHDMGPLGFYFLFGSGGRDIGGAFNKPADMPGPPAWLGYVRIKSMDKTVSKARAAGAQLINGPMEVPGGDRIAQLLDPQGAAFAIHVLKDDLRPAAPQPPEHLEVTVAPPVEKAAVRASVTAAKKRSAGKSSPRTIKRAAKTGGKKASAVRSKAKSVRRGGRKAVTVAARKVRKTGRKASAVTRKGAKKTVGKTARKTARKTMRSRSRKGK